MLEMAEFLLVLAETHRPERKSTPGETVVRFHRNAIWFRAERNGENKQKFCHVSIFNAQKAMRRCHVRHVIPHMRKMFFFRSALRTCPLVHTDSPCTVKKR